MTMQIRLNLVNNYDRAWGVLVLIRSSLNTRMTYMYKSVEFTFIPLVSHCFIFHFVREERLGSNYTSFLIFVRQTGLVLEQILHKWTSWKTGWRERECDRNNWWNPANKLCLYTFVTQRQLRDLHCWHCRVFVVLYTRLLLRIFKVLLLRIWMQVSVDVCEITVCSDSNYRACNASIASRLNAHLCSND